MSSVVFPSIGENLCQSVDRDAKDAKGTKDAKELTQRRRESRGTEKSFSVFSVNFCVFCGFLLTIGVNLCQSVDKHAKDAKIF